MALDWSHPKVTKATGSIHKSALGWSFWEAQRYSQSKKTWTMIEEQALELGYTWSEVKRIAVDMIQWKCCGCLMLQRVQQELTMVK
jgi:hypothetical protein